MPDSSDGKINTNGYNWICNPLLPEQKGNAMKVFESEIYGLNGNCCLPFKIVIEETFEKFVKSLEEEKFLNSRLSNNDSSSYVLKYNYIDGKRIPVYGGYSYNYCRVNEGVDYTYDRINILFHHQYNVEDLL